MVVRQRRGADGSADGSTGGGAAAGAAMLEDAGLLARATLRETAAQHCPFRLTGDLASARAGAACATLELRRGATAWVDGPSGVGKSSLTRCLAQAATAGHSCCIASRELGFEVEVELLGGAPLRLGVLQQEAVLVDSLSVGDNLRLALGLRGKASGRVQQLELLEALGVTGKRVLARAPGALSIGMRRRVALALVLCQDPDVVVLDEPFAALDARSAEGVARELRRLQRERGLCVVLVSHLPELARLLEPRQVLRLAPSDAFEGAAAATGIGPWILAALRPPAGVGPLSRTASELGHLLLVAAPLCLVAGLLVGGGFLSLVNSVLRFVDTEVLLQALPQSVRSNPMFASLQGKIKTYGAGFVARGKLKAVGLGLAYVCAVELAPLMVGVLMAGVVGSSLGGRVATLQATAQDRLLASLGYRPTTAWTAVPALLASVIGAPVLVGSCLAGLLWGGTGALRELSTAERHAVWTTTQDALRTHNLNGGQGLEGGALTFLPVICVYRAVGFMVAVVAAAEFATRVAFPSRAAKEVPSAIAMSVISSFVAVLAMEFVFAQVLVASVRVPEHLAAAAAQAAGDGN